MLVAYRLAKLLAQLVTASRETHTWPLESTKFVASTASGFIVATACKHVLGLLTHAKAGLRLKLLVGLHWNLLQTLSAYRPQHARSNNQRGQCNTLWNNCGRHGM